MKSAEESLVAGRELDALIAEKVMGFPKVRAELGEWGGAGHFPIPYYSTEIADAWQVVERVDNRNAVAKEMRVVRASINHYDDSYTARFFNSGATAETAPLAICLAALKAIA